MAILLTNPDGSYASDCAICNRPLTEPVFATTHFIADPSDRLWRYSDAGMHWKCYGNWEHQRQFAKQYFEASRLWKMNNPYWAKIVDSDTYFTTANPTLPEPEADITIRIIGPGFRVAIRDWTDWINSAWKDSCVHELQRSAMAEIEESIRQGVPDSETMLRFAKQNLAR